jgi:hypothetical protein
MKKLLTLTAMLGAATLSYGQGLVNFANGVASTTHVSTNSQVGGAVTGRISGPAGSYYFALFVAPTGTVFNAQLTGWSLVPGVGTNTTLGRFNGNPTTVGTVVPGYDISSTANFLVAGWSGNLGRDWAQVLPWYTTLQQTGQAPSDGFIGFSGVAANVVVGGGAIPVPTIFGPNAGQTLGFGVLMAPVPEPTSFALAGLGAAALLIFRRRK